MKYIVRSLCLVLLISFINLFYGVASGKTSDSKTLQTSMKKKVSNMDEHLRFKSVDDKRIIDFDVRREKLSKSRRRKRRRARRKSRKHIAKDKKLQDGPTTTRSSVQTTTALPRSIEDIMQEHNDHLPEFQNWLPGPKNRPCGECIWQDCQPVDAMKRHCPSGVVRDQCNCCVECASGVGMPCYLSSFAPIWLPPCGDDLVCSPFTDELDAVSSNEWGGRSNLEGHCTCTEKVPVCASNNITYDDVCIFREAASRITYDSSKTLQVSHPGPCSTAPVLDAGPQNVEAKVGGTSSFKCEASGFPLPRIQWFKEKSEESEEDFDYNFDVMGTEDERPTAIELPGFLKNAVTQIRGGPAKYQITTWLTLDKLRESDKGVYYCRATNNIGIATGSASLKITGA